MKDLTFTEIVITVSLFVMAVSAVVVANKTVSRDFNGDGQVNIVDLSIMAAEIQAANQK